MRSGPGVRQRSSSGDLLLLGGHAKAIKNTEGTQKSPRQFSFRHLHALVKQRNQTEIDKVIKLAAHHHHLILTSYWEILSAMSHHFADFACWGEALPFMYVAEQLRQESDHQTYNWLSETYKLPNTIHNPNSPANFSTNIITLAIEQRYNDLIAILENAPTDNNTDLLMLGILLSGVLLTEVSAGEKLCSIFRNYPAYCKAIRHFSYILYPELINNNNMHDIRHSLSVFINRKWIAFSSSLGLYDLHPGMCQGASIMNAQSYLCYDEAAIHQRNTLFLTMTLEQLKQQIVNAKQNIKKRAYTVRDLELLETSIYIENVGMLQKPKQLQGFFTLTSNTHLTQNKMRDLFPLIESQKMEKMGGLQVVGNYSSAYLSSKELTVVLSTINEYFIKQNPQFEGRFCLLMSTFSHAISIIYDAKQRLFTHINNGFVSEYPANALDKLTQHIMSAFKEQTSIILHTDILAAGKDFKLLQVAFNEICKIQPFNHIHTCTPERAMVLNAEGVSWLCLAVSHEAVSTVNYLLSQACDPNYHKHDYYSPLRISVALRNVSITNALLAAGANVHWRAPRDNLTPLDVARDIGFKLNQEFLPAPQHLHAVSDPRPETCTSPVRRTK